MAQLLVQVVSVNALAAGATVTVAHTLESNGAAVAPTLVIADRATSIAVQSVSTTGVTFINNGTASASANFRLERGWQPEVDASSVTPFLWNGGGGSSAGGTVTKVFALTSPVTGFGANTSGQTVFLSGQVTLPANTLGTGSTVQFRVSGIVNNATGAGLNTTMEFFADADGAAPGTGLLVSTGTVAGVPNGAPFVMVANATIRGSGNNVGATGGITGSYGAGTGGLNITGTYDGGLVGINTQATITLTMALTFGTANANNNFTINNFEVYIAR